MNKGYVNVSEEKMRELLKVPLGCLVVDVLLQGDGSFNVVLKDGEELPAVLEGDDIPEIFLKFPKDPWRHSSVVEDDVIIVE